MPRAIILGGGVAGLQAAHLLKDKAEVYVITENDYYISGPSRPLILSNEQQLDRIVRGYNHLPKEIKVLFGKAKIDLENNKVLVNNKELEYDYLIIATGIKYDYNAIDIKDKIYNVYDIGKLFDLKHLIWTINKGSILVYAPKQPYRCAPAPGETIMTIDMVLRHRKVRDNIKLIFVDANEKVQPPVIHDVWIKRFEEAGIEYYLGKEIVEVNEKGVKLNDGTFIEADYKVILPPNKANNPIGEGFIEVRSPKDLRLKDYDNVYAVGDVAKLPFPKNAEIALQSAINAANQIIAEIEGTEYKPQDYRFGGWAYMGNLKELKTESTFFSLDFSEGKPKGNKDPEPKVEYTKIKDQWEQSLLKKLFGY
ncbi:NEQ024 [Nanoarchaeum equitans Kin4-M]|uniref:NEQ024 n=1 Tax=Nanoarchaeum equitans (strain Kin4-M) TaxID=228908 RepID=Q74MH1_NANEQ|nr:NEQ024 [Nanoarchaeum equitans Kin4-M]